MQLCLTEYTNLKKCPLVTQNQEYSRDSRLNSFQSGGLKEKKKLSVSSRFSIAHSSLPHPKETQVHCNIRNLGEKASLSPMSIQLGVGVTHWRFQRFRLSSVLLWLLQQFYQLALTASMSLTKFWAKHIPNIWKRQQFIHLEHWTTPFTQANSLGYTELRYERNNRGRN